MNSQTASSHNTKRRAYRDADYCKIRRGIKSQWYSTCFAAETAFIM